MVVGVKHTIIFADVLRTDTSEPVAEINLKNVKVFGQCCCTFWRSYLANVTSKQPTKFVYYFLMYRTRHK
jgi:hypothetical protein